MYCQFNYRWFFLFCVALVGVSCSSNKPEKKEKNKNVTQIAYQEIKKPGWLKVPKRFSFKGEFSEYFFHPFFDSIPGKDFDKKFLNAILITPKNSHYFYNMDLPSGQIVKSFNFCPQKDITGDFKGVINKPDFSLGYIPRILDSTAQPQKVVIFGDVPRNLVPGMVTPIEVIGGVLELECDVWPCERSQGWKKRIVLVAVFQGEKEIRNLADLKQLYDWDYFKSFMENAQGVHSTLAIPRVGYQIRGQLSSEEALNMVFKDGHVFSSLELFTIRSSCHKLYDYVYETAVKKNKVKIDKNSPEFQSFKEFLLYFLKNYGERHYTCLKYVRSSNPFDGSDRHWFFSSFNAFINLRGLGYYFNCDDASWYRNPYDFQKKGMHYDFEKEMSKCDMEKINLAFDLSANKLQFLVKQNALSFRYVTFDNTIGGSHQKVYGWVTFKGLSPYCLDAQAREATLKDFQSSFFPLDVRWNPIK